MCGIYYKGIVNFTTQCFRNESKDEVVKTYELKFRTEVNAECRS